MSKEFKRCLRNQLKAIRKKAIEELKIIQGNEFDIHVSKSQIRWYYAKYSKLITQNAVTVLPPIETNVGLLAKTRHRYTFICMFKSEANQNFFRLSTHLPLIYYGYPLRFEVSIESVWRLLRKHFPVSSKDDYSFTTLLGTRDFSFLIKQLMRSRFYREHNLRGEDLPRCEGESSAIESQVMLT